MKKAQRWILLSLCGAGLVGVFMLYARPDFLVQLSNQIWACF